jgi:long-chain acyl-CoA synthetase
VPDQYHGESVKAFIVLKDGESLTQGEIIEYCKEKLASYKVPREVEFLTELPKSAIGKILRRELKEREMNRRGMK